MNKQKLQKFINQTKAYINLWNAVEADANSTNPYKSYFDMEGYIAFIKENYRFFEIMELLSLDDEKSLFFPEIDKIENLIPNIGEMIPVIQDIDLENITNRELAKRMLTFTKLQSIAEIAKEKAEFFEWVEQNVK